MAGIKIDNFSTSDVNLTAIMKTLQALKQGHFQLALTNMDNSSIPEISEGSVIELNGALIYIDADYTITGLATNGVCYIKMRYSSGVMSAEWTNIAPVFDVTKNGWYGTGGSSGDRYIARIVKSDTSYTDKTYLNQEVFPQEFESQFAYQAQRPMGYLETVTVTLTFSRTVKSIINFSLNGGNEAGTNSLSLMRLVSVVMTGNLVQVTLQNMTSSSFGTSMSYSIMITAEI